MAARLKYPVVNRTVVFQGNHVFSPEVRRARFAEIVGEQIEQIDRSNDAALGHDVHYRTFVDGKESARLANVRDGGSIEARWELGVGVIDYIADMLAKSGPRLTGRYRATFKVYADGKEIQDTIDAIGAREVLFVPTVAYARKIERGQGGYAPGHVCEAVAAMANARFSNVAKIKFTFAEPESPTPPVDPYLDYWARRNAARQSGARKRRAQLQKNRRQPAIVIYLT